MSEQDFPAGHKAKVQLALLFATGFPDQDETLRTALSLLRRKYTFVEHVIATMVGLSALGSNEDTYLCKSFCCEAGVIFY